MGSCGVQVVCSCGTALSSNDVSVRNQEQRDSGSREQSRLLLIHDLFSFFETAEQRMQ